MHRKVLARSVRSVVESLESRTLLTTATPFDLLSVGTGTASISGLVYTDSNGDGRLGPSEAGASNVTVFLDLNNSGALDSNEPSVLTDLNGEFTLADLAAGQY